MRTGISVRMRMAVVFCVALAAFVSPMVAELARAATVGNCTPGQRQCQVGMLMECYCEEDYVTEEETRVVCVWESTGESCGAQLEPPACDESREGATFRFPDEIKTCKCWDYGCEWQ